MLGNVGVVEVLFLLVIGVLPVVIAWRIFARTGMPGALGLLMLIPVVNLIMLLVLAFGEWPIERELAQLRQQVQGGPPGVPPTE